MLTPLATKRRKFAIALIGVWALLSATAPAAAEPAGGTGIDTSAATPPLSADPPGKTLEVRGLVVDADSGAPIEGASVHASRSEVFATTAKNGTFVLTGVPDSSALVIAGREGYAFAATTVGGSVTLKLHRDTDPARAEYPRPDADRRPFTDDTWMSLNGTWSFDFDPDNVGEDERWFDPDHEFGKAIRVPFGYQSLAAWGEEELATKEIFRSAFSSYRGTVWYRRSFTVPEDFSGQKVRLRIGAADWGAAVWLDGEPVLPYSGDGYTEISAGLGSLTPGSTHTVTIRAVAPPTTPDSPYPMGKQTGLPDGENTGWFSDIGGIWQSVWIEPYADARLTQTQVTPELTFEGNARNPSAAAAKIDVTAVGGTTATVKVKDPDGEVVDTVNMPLSEGQGTARIPIKNPHLWEPDDPALYTADIRLDDDDGIRTTFGMRKVERKWAPGHTDEYQYVYLNNRPIYVRGVLDQGYNPWGIYTYTGVTAGPDLQTGTEADPGRGSILRDLKSAKELGFNVVRHHLKVNEPAYYHWADKLGLMIWYDLPNAGWHSLGEEAEQLFEELLRNTLQRDHNHPSIVIWNIFNESWGINEMPFQEPIPAEAFPYVRRMVDITRSLDPSRLVVDNSACCQNGHLDTDLNDFHYYLNTYDQWKNLLDGFNAQVKPGSTWNFNDGAQSGQPWLNSEFSTRGGQFPHQVSLFRAYPKLNGYVGVQLAETEQEIHSPFRFDRQPNEPEFVDHRGRTRTIDMFQGDDAVSLMSKSTRTVDRGDSIDVPVKISHFSDDDLSGAELRWKIGGYDDEGRWVADAGGGSRSIDPALYTVSDAGTVSVTAPDELRVGYLWVWLEVDGKTVAENYLTFDTPGPDGESDFSPSHVTAQAWTGGAQAQTTGGSDWVTGYGRGYFEYKVQVPEEVRTGRAYTATLIAEVASAQAPGWYDPNNVTSARRYPTRLTVSVNGRSLPAITLPDDPHGPMALAGRSRGSVGGDFGNRYGYRIAIPITSKQLGDADTMTLRLTSDGGGLSILGASSGRHGIPPTLVSGRVSVPEERPQVRPVDSRLSVYQAPAAVSLTTGSGTAIVSVVNDTAKTVRNIGVRLAAPDGWTATGTELTTIRSLEPGEARHIAFTVQAESEVSAGQTADFTATASWGDHAIQAISTSTVDFDPEAYSEVGVDDTFDTDSSADYTVYKPSAGEALPQLTFGAGSLQAEGPGAYYALVAHGSGPKSSRAAVIVDHGKWAGTGQGQDALFNGLVKDERNYVMAWTGIRGNHGIDFRIDGQLTSACCSPAPLDSGDRWAFVLDGNSITIWIDRGLGWSRIMTSTTQGRIDFTQPGALDGWHYAAGLRSNAGTQAIGRLEGRSDSD
ncbi:glycoside hydrolase family 2 TIM barrel-domain containing protein [Actinopolymorpha sp. B9G3]|uniref:glycoside hydrolase family 2 TIM barrel-domain containing protein n=1 Tax=Actinopolymorpha sp. B9G3 TaxID=3158970 RepID=UPI0032D8D470